MNADDIMRQAKQAGEKHDELFLARPAPLWDYSPGAPLSEPEDADISPYDNWDEDEGDQDREEADESVWDVDHE